MDDNSNTEIHRREAWCAAASALPGFVLLVARGEAKRLRAHRWCPNSSRMETGKRRLTALMAAVALAALFAGAPLAASAQTTQDPHHAADQAGTQPAAPAEQPGATPAPGAQPGMTGAAGAQPAMMGNMPMMANMMGMMANMMAMMGTMGQASAGAPAMAPNGPGMASAPALDHVEGRIAFLRAELGITEAQAGVWDAFADAFRTNAKTLGDLRGTMMPPAGAGSPQAATPVQRLDLEERWLAARLDGVRAIKSAFETLYAALSAEQKKTADELLASPMGPMPMTVMPLTMMPTGGPQP
ncbi:MAG: Spy/CpxP family protein refolding chaperone [Pseudomonadota bacterium]